MSRRFVIFSGFILVLLGCAAPALAASPFDISWQALDPGNDWVAQMIRAVFPINGNPCAGGPQSATCTGSAATVIGQIIGQLTGFTMAIAMAYVCYLTIINMHRVAESSALFTNAMSSLFVVRLGFAAIMIFPTPAGFSVGQAAVVQVSMWGIGMAKTVYQNAIQAIGPDAMVIALPIIPGTKNVVLGLMQDEICRAFVNEATANPQMAPIPTPTTTAGSTTWAYTLSPGNQTGLPACGTITVNQPAGAQAPIAGVNTDMTAQQLQILQNVITNDIRPAVSSVAKNYWQTKMTSALTPLLQAYTTATQDYTQQLTSAATQVTQQLQNALKAQDARNGNLGLVTNETNLSTLGWASAGSYYLTFSQLNGRTLSLLNDLPIVNTPNYGGFSGALKSDLAPLLATTDSFFGNLRTYVNTADGINAPTGNADTFGKTAIKDGGTMIESIFRTLNLTEPLLAFFAEQMSPTRNQWSDPFGGLIVLGQKLTSASLIALGLAMAASSTAFATTTGAFSGFLTGGFGGALTGAATANALSGIIQAFAVPIFIGILALLMPGLTIAYILPMIPWVMWMAGVAGYLILVIEAVIAVPLMMLAHMTFEGSGLHGKAIQAYELLFNVLFRPVLMLLGLFLGYFIFASMSWLVRMSFGVAVHFLLEKGWIVTNVVGMVVLLSIFVLVHIVLAMQSFRMIALVPHHLPKMLGFSSANRIDLDDFSEAAAWTGTRGTLSAISKSLQPPESNTSGQNAANISGSSPKPALSGPRNALMGPSKSSSSKGSGNMDSTLNASTDIGSPKTAE